MRKLTFMAERENQSEKQIDDADEGSIESSTSALQLEVNDEADQDHGDEFTLETLSEAYAEVVGSEDGPDDDIDADEPEESDTDDVRGEAADEVEEDDDAACQISPDSIIESMLFVGAPKGIKLTSRIIAAVLRDVSPKEVSQIVKKLNTRYEEQDAAWRIATEKGDYRMVLHESLNKIQDEYFGRNREYKLNQTSIDVLAVVAYHQPASRQQIETIRGKNCGSVLNQLVKRQLLSRETSDETPAEKQYCTTDRFLDLFGLTEIQDLPQSHEIADIEDLAD